MARQVRSENTYQKINTLYKRDEKGYIINDGTFVSPEYEYLKSLQWEATEKIDGTNMRVEVYHTIDDDIENPTSITWWISIKGKTDNANIPSHLLKYMQETFTEEKVLNALGLKKNMNQHDWIEKGWIVSSEDPTPVYEKIPKMYTLYGEGYGVKIQKGGGRYLSNAVAFRGFDVKVNDLYLLSDNVKDIYGKLGVELVPDLGMMTIDEAIGIVKQGFVSRISEDKTYIAEGIVLKTPFGLKDRFGRRLIIKIKYKDYEKLNNRK